MSSSNSILLMTKSETAPTKANRHWDIKLEKLVGAGQTGEWEEVGRNRRPWSSEPPCY